MSYRDWSIVRVTGVGTITIDPGDASTAFTAYRDGSTRCADQTRGVEVEGFARADNGDLVMVTITMCDNGPAGSGADEFHILIPEGGPYEKAGSLSLGDVAKIAGSPPSPAFSRATGLGAIGPGAPTLGSDRQDFDFDVNSVETGRLFYRDYSVVRNGGAGQLVVDAADAATGFAAFHQTTSNCVRITGTGRIDTGDLLRFYVDACDNASPGTGFDRFTLTVPDRMGRGVPYVRSGALSSGDVALGNGAAATPGSVSVTTTTTGSSVDPDGYTVRLDGGSSRAIAVNGSVTYTNVAAGSHTIVLSGVAANCSVEGGTTRTVTVPDGGSASVTFGVSCTSQATGLAFTVQPSDTRAGEDIKPAVHVTVVDAQGNRVTSFTGDVTVAIGRNGGLLMPGTLSGVTTVTAVSGIATFFDLTIDQIGNGYTLRATAPGLTGAESQPFNVGP